MVQVQWLSLKKETPPQGYWDYGLLEELLEDFPDVITGSILPDEFSIVVLPARHHADMVKQVNKELAKLDSVLLFLMGDEENDFPIEKIKHERILIWVQNPPKDMNDKYRKLGCGYPPLIHKCEKLVEKDIDWSFAGQITHERRELCVSKLKEIGGGALIETEGFTQGIPQDEYYELMSKSKVVVCPSGPVTVDTFRAFEALELGCVPIVDTETPRAAWHGFWEWLFDGPVPFPTINDYDNLPGYIKDAVDKYPVINNRCQSWWMQYKSSLKKQIYADIKHLGGEHALPDITVVIPVSPIPSHPETDTLEETIGSVRHHLPDSEIILKFDGIRSEQEASRKNYEEHIRRVLWKARKWGHITPYIFEEHLHQSGMMKYIMDKIKTPLLLYVEQDTPLVTDEEIDWRIVKDAILSGESNVIRFHHESRIPTEHNHLMIGGVVNQLQKTYQWSQRPHLASTAFYRRMMNENFSDKSNCFIEDLAHGKAQMAYISDRKMGWNQWRVHIYMPGKNIKRSYHTDGRKGAKKYDEKQVW